MNVLTGALTRLVFGFLLQNGGVTRFSVILGQFLLKDFTVVSTAGGYLGSDDFLEFVTAAEQGKQQTGFFEGRGPIAILALILLGGLALTLTPCVLPMIPINLAIIGAGGWGTAIAIAVMNSER